MQLIADAPLLLAEVKRAYQLIVDAAWQLHWNVGTIAASDPMSSKEWDENIHAPAQAWRRQVQDILDASEEGCPWKESEEE